MADRVDEMDVGTGESPSNQGDQAPYPTSVALVMQWMTEHYAEHVPHAEQLFATWQKSQ